MLWLRRHRLYLVLVACAQLLFMQLALAQYVCPGMGALAAAGTSTQADTAHGADCPDAGNPERAALCMAHCQAAGSSPQAHPVPVFAPLPLNGMPPPWAHALQPPFAAALLSSRWTDHAFSPPIGLRHCCLRI
jgi:hypothetical protein